MGIKEESGMNWIDNLLSKVFDKKETEIINITFKGKATKDKFEISLLDAGFKAGYNYALETWTESGEFKTFPDFMKHEHGFYWNGWAEGVKTGISKHLDRIYPGAKSLSYNRVTKKYDVTY